MILNHTMIDFTLTGLLIHYAQEQVIFRRSDLFITSMTVLLQCESQREFKVSPMISSGRQMSLACNNIAKLVMLCLLYSPVL